MVESQIQQLSQQVQERLKWLIDLEFSPYTQNYHHFSLYRDKYLSRYKAERSVSITSYITLLMVSEETLGYAS